MPHRPRLVPRYRTVRTVPWWFSHAEKTAVALLIVYVLLVIGLLLFGVPEGPR